MALVDYSSSSSGSQESLHEPPAKRRRDAVDEEPEPEAETGSKPPQKVARDGTAGKEKHGSDVKLDGNSSGGGYDMPPLPSTFHDLYASTVRQSVVDDPSLHQGRKRQTPHVPGNWPSHVYVEWHPTTSQHDLLVKLMAAVTAEIGSDVKLKDFLTSDLGAPTPLHISLSRPLSLSTADKDEFLDRVTTAIQASTVSSFNVTPKSLAWYKSPDSDRLFLIIRVVTAGHASSTNPELVTLLNRCNGVASLFGQPRLYANKNVDGQQVGAAFHVSIAWTFDIPGEAASLRSLSVFRQADFKEVSEWRIEVGAVKVKIGNMVHHIPLGTGSRVGRGATWSRKVEGEGDGEFKG